MAKSHRSGCFCVEKQRHTNASGFKKKLRSGLTLFCVTGDVLTSFRTPYFIQVKSIIPLIPHSTSFVFVFRRKTNHLHRPLSLPGLLLLPSPSSLSPTPFLPSLSARPSFRPPARPFVRPPVFPSARPSFLRSFVLLPSFSRP